MSKLHLYIMGLHLVFFSFFLSFLPSFSLDDGGGEKRDCAVVISVPHLVTTSLLPSCWLGLCNQHHQSNSIIRQNRINSIGLICGMKCPGSYAIATHLPTSRMC